MHRYEVRATVEPNGWLDFTVEASSFVDALVEADAWVVANCPKADVWAITELAEDDDESGG